MMILAAFLHFLETKSFRQWRRKQQSSLSNFTYLRPCRKGSCGPLSRLWRPRLELNLQKFTLNKPTAGLTHAICLFWMKSHIHVNVCVKILESVFLFLVGKLYTWPAVTATSNARLIRIVVRSALCPAANKGQLCRLCSFLTSAHLKFSSQALKSPLTLLAAICSP